MAGRICGSMLPTSRRPKREPPEAVAVDGTKDPTRSAETASTENARVLMPPLLLPALWGTRRTYIPASPRVNGQPVVVQPLAGRGDRRNKRSEERRVGKECR